MSSDQSRFYMLLPTEMLRKELEKEELDVRPITEVTAELKLHRNDPHVRLMVRYSPGSYARSAVTVGRFCQKCGDPTRFSSSLVLLRYTTFKGPVIRTFCKNCTPLFDLPKRDKIQLFEIPCQRA